MNIFCIFAKVMTVTVITNTIFAAEPKRSKDDSVDGTQTYWKDGALTAMW